MDINLSERAQKVFELEAERLSMPVEYVVQMHLEREAERLAHVQRCAPKGKEKRPVGRPRVGPETRRLRELAGQLRLVYFKLRERFGEDINEYERTHGEAERRLEAAIERGDLAELQRIEREQPWVKRWRQAEPDEQELPPLREAR